jgi:hypothetical protein
LIETPISVDDHGLAGVQPSAIPLVRLEKRLVNLAQIIPVDPDNAGALARYANEIRARRKRASSDMIEIGRMLVESKKLVGHGNWLSWPEREFQWTENTARNFIRVHEMAKTANFADLSNIPISGLFLLARPSTPETAKQEAISRAEAGEPMTLNTVKEIVRRAKQDDRRGARAEVEVHGDASKQHKDAARAKGAGLTPDHHLIWEIKAALGHLEDAVQDVKKFKPRMSEVEKYAVGMAFLEAAKLAYSGANVVKLKEEPTK